VRRLFRTHEGNKKFLQITDVREVEFVSMQVHVQPLAHAVKQRAFDADMKGVFDNFAPAVCAAKTACACEQVCVGPSPSSQVDMQLCDADPK
jgi:hypothetical protein